jgi:glycosyltransferase involved in cell wall biosynthesis
MVRQCSTYIFYIRDFLTIQPYFKKHGVRLEQQMIHNSDLVVANSGYLAKYAAKWNRYSYDIGQGCDLEAYQAIEYPMPADLAEIPHPVIGYCGAITAMRLDESIVSHLAESFPECSIVLVGPEDDFFRKSSLKDLKNVFFLGGKTPREVPSYISHFDICINPQLTNELTIGNYPRKIDEYLAMGKPTVATATDGMLIFKDNVFLCNSKKEYADQIRKILMDPNLSGDEIKRERINFALSHTWENSIGLLGGAYFDSIKKN